MGSYGSSPLVTPRASQEEVLGQAEGRAADPLFLPHLLPCLLAASSAWQVNLGSALFFLRTSLASGRVSFFSFFLGSTLPKLGSHRASGSAPYSTQCSALLPGLTCCLAQAGCPSLSFSPRTPVCWDGWRLVTPPRPCHLPAGELAPCSLGPRTLWVGADFLLLWKPS